MESIDKYKGGIGSAASKHGFESATNFQERKIVDTVLETLIRRVERAEDENDYLSEAVNGNFSNGKRVEEKIDTERVTISNMLEKMTNMEKTNEERMEKLTKEHKAELTRGRSYGNSGGKRDNKRLQFEQQEEKNARIKAK